MMGTEFKFQTETAMTAFCKALDAAQGVYQVSFKNNLFIVKVKGQFVKKTVP